MELKVNNLLVCLLPGWASQSISGKRVAVLHSHTCWNNKYSKMPSAMLTRVAAEPFSMSMFHKRACHTVKQWKTWKGNNRFRTRCLGKIQPTTKSIDHKIDDKNAQVLQRVFRTHLQKWQRLTKAERMEATNARGIQTSKINSEDSSLFCNGAFV